MVADSPAIQSQHVIRLIVRGLACDIGLPLVTYYVLHSFGASDWVALLSATLVAGARVVFVAVRARTLNLFALLIAVVFAIGLGLTFLTGDARFLLVKDSITTGVVGGAFLITALIGRPITLSVMRTWRSEQRAGLAERARTDPRVRHGHLVVSTAWGVGLLVEAAIRIPLVYLLPIKVMVGVSAGMMITALAVLIVFTGWYIRRAGPTAAEPSPAT